MSNKTDIDAVIRAIKEEIFYQDNKFGFEKPQSLPGFIVILENEIAEAKQGWTKDLPGRSSPLHEITQVAAVAIQCLMRYGTEGNTISTNDVAEDPIVIPEIPKSN